MDSDIQATLSALKAQVDRQEATIAELRATVMGLRSQQCFSMKNTRMCPGCGARSLLHIRKLKDHAHHGSIDLAIDHETSVWTGVETHGALEGFACLGCGLLELHVIDFKDVQVDGEKIVLIEADKDPPKAGPFR